MQQLTQNLLDAALAIATKAGEHLTAFYSKSVEIKTKQDDSPVTEADLFLCEFITSRLKALTPEIPVLSEENCDVPFKERSHWEQYWIIDPLDGTRQFINRTDQFSVLITLVQNNRPKLGIIHAPIIGKTYYAMKGNGAFLIENGETKKLSKKPVESDRLSITLCPTNRAPIEDYILEPYQSEFIYYGSSSLKSGLVAEGKADSYIRFGETGEWDTAASEILLEEVGGAVFSLDFKPLTYNERESFINPPFLMVADNNHDWKNTYQFDK